MILKWALAILSLSRLHTASQSCCRSEDRTNVIERCQTYDVDHCMRKSQCEWECAPHNSPLLGRSPIPRGTTPPTTLSPEDFEQTAGRSRFSVDTEEITEETDVAPSTSVEEMQMSYFETSEESRDEIVATLSEESETKNVDSTPHVSAENTTPIVSTVESSESIDYTEAWSWGGRYEVPNGEWCGNPSCGGCTTVVQLTPVLDTVGKYELYSQVWNQTESGEFIGPYEMGTTIRESEDDSHWMYSRLAESKGMGFVMFKHSSGEYMEFIPLSQLFHIEDLCSTVLFRIKKQNDDDTIELLRKTSKQTFLSTSTIQTRNKNLKWIVDEFTLSRLLFVFGLIMLAYICVINCSRLWSKQPQRCRSFERV